MAFIASFWWLWLVLGVASILFLIFSFFFRSKKMVDTIGCNSQPQMSLFRFAGTSLVQVLLTNIFAGICWLLFVLAMIIKVIDYIKS
jgi:uncharacterized membrane protein YhaH (DUF805 family)